MAVNRNKDKKIVLRQVNMRAPVRNRLDIEKWRSAIRAAESIHSPNRLPLLDIYSDCLYDGRLESVLEKRVNAILNIKLRFFDKEKKEVDEINDMIKKTFFEDLLTEIINSKFYGFSLLELEWMPKGAEGDSITHLVDRRFVKPHKSIVVKNPTDQNGEDYEQHPLALFCGSKKKLGLLAIAAQYIIYKRTNTADWAEYNEQQLKQNNYVFAAFKTHKQQNELAQQLTDEKGNLRSFNEFAQAVEPITENYNRAWLNTEYNTAVMRARLAQQFKTFERDADIFPNLRL